MGIIRIRVEKGEEKIDYVGYQGKDCDKADEKFKRSLSSIVEFNVIKRINKPEYNEGEKHEDMYRQ